MNYFDRLCCINAASLGIMCLCSALGPGIKMPVYPEKVSPTLKKRRRDKRARQLRGHGKQCPYGSDNPSHGVTFSV